ncbi:MAG: hypothetical protein WA061_04265 [Microgenomates group bacterium]
MKIKNKKIAKYVRPSVVSLLKTSTRFGSNKKGREIGIEELLATTKA